MLTKIQKTINMSKLKIAKNKEKIVKLLNENIDLEYNLKLKSFNRF